MRLKSHTSMAATAGLMSLICTPPAQAQLGLSPSVADLVLYGVGREDGRLVRYEYGTNTISQVGNVFMGTGGTLTGIDAAAYIPSHLNMYAFWTDPTDGHARMIYINLETAEAVQIGEPLGPGRMTGAAAIPIPDDGWRFPNPDGSTDALDPVNFTILAIYQSDDTVQTQTVNGCTPVVGDLNINPNNSPDSEFTVTMTDDSTFSRDELHAKDVQLEDGVYYSGPAKSVWVKPKGNAGSLMLDGEPYDIENGRNYLIAGQDMTITVYNDHLNKNGRAMGHWWVRVDTPCGAVGDGSEDSDTSPPPPSMPSGLYQIDHQTGRSRLVMELTGEYSSLAALDGSRFLASRGTRIYLLDPDAHTETFLGDALFGTIGGMDYARTSLMAFENNGNRLLPLSDQTGTLIGLPSRITGFSGLGSVIFMNMNDNPALFFAERD